MNKRNIAQWVLDPNGLDYNLPAWKCSNCNCVNHNIPPVLIGKDDIPIKINPYMFSGSRYCPNCGYEMAEPQE